MVQLDTFQNEFTFAEFNSQAKWRTAVYGRWHQLESYAKQDINTSEGATATKNEKHTHTTRQRQTIQSTTFTCYTGTVCMGGE